MRFKGIVIKLVIYASLAGCISCAEKSMIQGNGNTDTRYNLILTISDTDIDNPDNDRRAYYEVFIDKTESGRTTIALESQKKVFEAKLTPDRHLIKIEKWVLDDAQGRYIKLNNIYQPKPNFIYVNTENKKITRINVQSSKFGTALYTSTTE